ncbi:MAG: hypothetical protein SWY16_25440 [Cyanobacteriota bacterium]|nr:hypothetical protein [Cyanobacteriota bacterium]
MGNREQGTRNREYGLSPPAPEASEAPVSHLHECPRLLGATAMIPVLLRVIDFWRTEARFWENGRSMAETLALTEVGAIGAKKGFDKYTG